MEGEEPPSERMRTIHAISVVSMDRYKKEDRRQEPPPTGRSIL
jgi:hypothetical protein